MSNLKNHELDQVADFRGHDIRVHGQYYRLPEATTQLAKISKLLLAMEKGNLANLQGKTLEKLDVTDCESGESEDDCDPLPKANNTECDNDQDECSDGRIGDMPPAEKPPATESVMPISPDELPETSAGNGSAGPLPEKPSDTSAALPENETEKDHPWRSQRRKWSPAEIAAVMRHFQKHIDTGKLASFIEIQQCQKAEYPLLESRSLQNMRDFVRNRGITNKRRKAKS